MAGDPVLVDLNQKTADYSQSANDEHVLLAVYEPNLPTNIAIFADIT